MRRDILLLLLLTMLISCCSPDKRGKTINFEFAKTESLIEPPGTMSDENFTMGAYYTTLVKMEGVKNFPYDYALYFSTDHASDKGGIWLYLCNGKPSQAASWVSYDDALAAGRFDYLTIKPAGNPIYTDTILGRQTETPHANVIDGKVYMSYHNYLDHLGWQATMMAISDDGVNYKRIFEDDRAIVLKPVEFLDHTGYFRWGPNMFSGVNYKFVGYSLRRGTIDYRSSMWGSNDAIHWDELQMINGWKTDQSIPEADRFLIWHEMDPTSIREIKGNEYVAICCAGTRAAGKMKRLTELYEVFLAPDGCTQTRMARKIMGVGGKDSDDYEECSSSALTFINDSLHMVYVGTADEGKINTVMGAVGVFNANASMTSELADSIRQYHFYSQEEYKKELYNLGNSTIVFFAGDNGTDTDKPRITRSGIVTGGKRILNDGGTHVPLITYWPGKVVPNRKADDLIDFADIFPTFCELAGVTIPDSDSIDGISFIDPLLGRGEGHRKWITASHQDDFIVYNGEWRLHHNGNKLVDCRNLPDEKIVDINSEEAKMALTELLPILNRLRNL